MNKELEEKLFSTNHDNWNFDYFPTKLMEENRFLGKVDLRGIKRSSCTLPSRTFYQADLSYWECKHSDFSRCDLSDSFVLRSDLELSNFYGSSVERTIFVATNLGSCEFKHTDLRTTQFIDCNLVGARFQETRLNWNSGTILGEILRQNSHHRYCDRADFAKLVSTADWFGRGWEYFKFYLGKERPDLIEWVFNTLRPYVEYDGPKFVREYIR